MKRRAFAAIVVLAVTASGCSTTAQLADPRPSSPPPATTAVNRPPTGKIEGVPDKTATAGSTWTLQANAYDADNDRLTLEWTATGGTFSNATTPRTIWTAPAQSGAVTITLTVTDSAGTSGTDAVTIDVRARP